MVNHEATQPYQSDNGKWRAGEGWLPEKIGDTRLGMLTGNANQPIPQDDATPDNPGILPQIEQPVIKRLSLLAEGDQAKKDPWTAVSCEASLKALLTTLPEDVEENAARKLRERERCIVPHKPLTLPLTRTENNLDNRKDSLVSLIA